MDADCRPSYLVQDKEDRLVETIICVGCGDDIGGIYENEQGDKHIEAHMPCRELIEVATGEYICEGCWDD